MLWIEVNKTESNPELLITVLNESRRFCISLSEKVPLTLSPLGISLRFGRSFFLLSIIRPYVVWLAGEGSNLQPPGPKPGILPIELPANTYTVPPSFEGRSGNVDKAVNVSSTWVH